MTDLLTPPATDVIDQGRILLVDDNPTNIDVLYEFLSDVGYEVFVAEDGPSAISRLDFMLPDLILLDIMMPHMDGFEVCDHLKTQDRAREIPVIFITAMGAVDDKVRGFDAGGVDYITKPFQNQEVLARIRTHLSMKRMREALRSKNQQLLEQNNALDAYARTVAHDLKNPLNLILNYARLIQDEGALSGMAAQDLSTIIMSADRMNHIIQDLLLLAQLRKDEVTAVNVDMASVVRQSLDRLAFQLSEKNVQVTEPPEWIPAMGVASWLQGVWVNYISNALKYGGEPPRITLQCRRVGNLVEYAVEDNGPGIPEEAQAGIFDEFSRVGGEKAEGHGVGLAIVKRIVERLQGEVGVRNLSPGPGCRFLFTLPAVETE